MASIPILGRLKTIGNLIASQSFFVTLFVILVLTLIQWNLRKKLVYNEE